MSRIYLALSRFGLGAARDEAPPADPQRWLMAQFESYNPRPAAVASAPARTEVATQLADYLAEVRSATAQGLRPRQAAEMRRQMTNGQADQGANAELPESARQFIRKASQDYYLGCVAARTNAALTTSAPFVERLVHFWANHFAVSADKLPVIGMSGLLEIEAIRPHVLGRFGDMLLAVEQHPAMLLYLDQAQSIGPDSMVGEFVAARGRRQAGLNENLAREILELHTLGVKGGYSQADVTEFARALTGWTVSGITRGPAARMMSGGGDPGAFVFASALHEPGRRTLLGRSYDQQGLDQAKTILAELATHPSTAQHLATKLARHFVADDPPPALVERLSATYLKTGGDLPSLYRILIEAPEAWSGQPAKFKTPWDWTISSLRGLGIREIQGQPVAGLMMQLGQPLWRPGSPAGYDDIAASWAGPDALVRRVEAAERLVGRTADTLDARQLAPKLLADALTPATAQAIARAESPAQGLALMLVAPEFLRR
jgi:uncharacterized protein (DUF1800 family)